MIGRYCLALLGVTAVALSEGFAIPTKRQSFLSSTTSSSTSDLWYPNMPSKITATATSKALNGRGGGSVAAKPNSKLKIGSLWGSLGVIYILAKAIKRVLPIALEPIQGDLVLSPVQWGMYALSCLMFAYAEGYKGFQKKFSPLVVKRSLGVSGIVNTLLAPVYSMGLIHATKKRLITSWCVTLGVTALVVIVKKLPPIARCILDAGVVVGLTYGSLSILWLYLQHLFGGSALDNVDPCLPNKEKND